MSHERKAWRKRARIESASHPQFAIGSERALNQELEFKHKAYAAGNLGALRDALIICSKEMIPLPGWLTSGLDELLVYEISAPHGRLSGWLKKYQRDMIDFARADAVEECRDHGLRWREVYVRASELLAREGDAVSEDAIEKSYKRFKRQSKQDPFRYHQLKYIRLSRVTK